MFPANQTPEKSKHRSFYIQNTSADHGANAHWLAIACEPGEPDLLFDTFARPPTATWLPHLRHMETTDPNSPRPKSYLGRKVAQRVWATFGTVGDNPRDSQFQGAST